MKDAAQINKKKAQTKKGQSSCIPPLFYRLPDVKKRLGVSGSTIWAWIKQGTFPAGVKLSANITAWRADEVDNWAYDRIADSE